MFKKQRTLEEILNDQDKLEIEYYERSKKLISELEQYFQRQWPT
jgi:hypothetical protein